MKKLIATLSTIAILTGSVAAPLPWTNLTGITIECQAATGTKTTVSVSGINYTVYYRQPLPQSKKQAEICLQALRFLKQSRSAPFLTA